MTSSPPPGASLHYQTSERADALPAIVFDRAIAIPTPCDNAKTRGGRSISMSSASPLFPSVGWLGMSKRSVFQTARGATAFVLFLVSDALLVLAWLLARPAAAVTLAAKWVTRAAERVGRPVRLAEIAAPSIRSPEESTRRHGGT